MYKAFLKRTIDLVLSFFGIVILAIPMGVVALAIKLDDPGPALFKQKRVGQHKVFFQLYKFRSMKMNTPDIPTHLLENPEQYITKIGGFLRKTSLDELPQLFNIFVGDMSIIGPRAFLPTNFPGYENLKPRSQRRLDALPGITGYCQAYYRNNATLQEKIEYDAYYVDNLSFAMDVKVLIQTVVSVLKRDNIYVAPNEEAEKKAKDAVEAGKK